MSLKKYFPSVFSIKLTSLLVLEGICNTDILLEIFLFMPHYSYSLIVFFSIKLQVFSQVIEKSSMTSYDMLTNIEDYLIKN